MTLTITEKMRPKRLQESMSFYYAMRAYIARQKVDDMAKSPGLTDRTIKHIQKPIVEEGLEVDLET